MHDCTCTRTHTHTHVHTHLHQHTTHTKKEEGTTTTRLFVYPGKLQVLLHTSGAMKDHIDKAQEVWALSYPLTCHTAMQTSVSPLSNGMKWQSSLARFMWVCAVYVDAWVWVHGCWYVWVWV
jgi:hypothetical protein